MKKKSSGSVRASRVSPDSFEPRLRAYSTLSGAALATGAAILGTTAAASAQTIHPITAITGTTTVLMPPSRNLSSSAFAAFHFALGAGSAAFVLKAGLGPDPNSSGLYMQGADGLRVSVGAQKVVNLGHIPNAVAVQGGTFRTPGFYYARLFGRLTSNHTGNFQATGNNHVTGYVGFRKFQDASHHYYGWLRVQVTASAGRPDTLSLIPVNGIYGAYALNSINAGATAIPEPASVATGLALFALGAVGVREHRRRKLAV